MSKAPYMKLWCSDFLGDTLHLSQAEIGQYMLILMAMWNNGGTLPKSKLRTCARGKVSADVMAFFDIKDGVVTNERLTTEVKNSQEFSEVQRVKARRKHLKDKERASAEAHAPEMPYHSHSHKDSSDSEDNGESLAANDSFKGEVINLNKKDYAAWKLAYARLDLDAELLARDAWLVDNPDRRKNWFASTSQHLNNRNLKAKAAVAANGKPFKTRTQIANEKIDEEMADGRFGGPGICEERGPDAYPQLPKPSARPRDVSEAVNYPVHWTAKTGFAEN